MNTARLVTIALLFTFLTLTLAAQTTEFTYQGNLVNNGAPATGNYDFEFLLYDALSGGTQLGTTQTRSGVAVANGTFSVNLDFGSQFPGSARFIEIRVRAAGGGAYTTLAPRQSINSTPYSVKSLSAENATNATNATTATNFMGTLAGDVTGTQSATVIANSAVTTAKIADANVTNAKIANLAVTDAKITDVAGSKITGTIPLASIPVGSGNYIQNSTTLQAASNFNISGNGTANIFNALTQFNLSGDRVLSNAGTNNLFAGVGAGQANSTGFSNAFFGQSAGANNTTGNYNAFFGQSAGQANTTGAFNAFFGRDAGFSNTTSGSNAFFGWSAGYSNTTGSENAFFGTSAGYLNTDGQANAYFGANAGFSNTTGFGNVFFGIDAGYQNTAGNLNTIIGYNANVGSGNLTNAAAIGGNAFVTQSNSLVLGSINGTNGATADTFVGIGTTTPAQRLHVVGNGLFTGNLTVSGLLTATVSASGITGVLNATNGGTGISTVGAAGNFLRSNGTIWSSSAITPTDIPAGNAFYIQNGTTLQGASNFNISGNGTAGGTLSGNIVNAATQYNIGGSRVLSVAGFDNLFAGVGAGNANSGQSNAFFGRSAGLNNTTGSENAFFGTNAGYFNTTGDSNAFFGRSAGVTNSTGGYNSFFGIGAGLYNATGGGNSFFGTEAGSSNTTGIRNTTIGIYANVGAGNLTNATALGALAMVSQSNSLVLGSINGVNGATADTRVGIGTTAPEQSLHVNGTEVLSTGSQSGFKFRERGSTTSADDWVLFSEAGIGRIWRFGAGDILTFTSSGLVGINNLGAAGSTTLCRNASNQISSCSSSLRYKTNIGRFNSGMSFVNQLRPITFDWKDGGMKDVGFGAEDIAKIDPRFVTYNDKGEVEGVKYDRLSAAFVNAFKEQQTEISELRAVSNQQAKRIEEQKETINRQHAQNLKMQSQIDALKKFICATNKSAEICKEE